MLEASADQKEMRNNTVVPGPRALVTSIGVLLAGIGSLMFFLQGADEVPLTTHFANLPTVILFITPQRAVGLVLILAASWVTASCVGRVIWKPTTSLALWAYLTALLTAVGYWLSVGMDSDVGNFQGGEGFPFALFLTTQRAVGLALLWIASMSVVGILGRWFNPAKPQRPIAVADRP